ncbi:MAG: translation elongation factor Ts [Candidatus Berkelbacteria bacterium]|nr:MAG: translation elongation factor Ts [Candidatus Berkelbacteria bacterium]QQG51546.1 MAG: translation elongation factor Ts [Candidatus Berkelbacteria bacterium]
MNITVEQIKSLRAKTGLGIHDVKRALEEAGSDEAKAMALLKDWGLSTVAKKADRATGQGLIETYVHGGGRIGAMVEVNCETDFVARNEDFKKFVREIALQVASMKPENVDELLKQEYFRDPSLTIEQLLNDTIAKIGENMKINRVARFELGE